MAANRTLKIAHFNDVYHVIERGAEPVAGAARFAGALHAEGASGKASGEEGDTMVLFSGDAFAPSLDSTITKGAHMPPVLNAFGIAAACFGNHDFDFGTETLASLLDATNFPWICSNAFKTRTDENEDKVPLMGADHHLVVQWGEVKVGIMGLVEAEWLDTLATLDNSEVDYVDFVEAAKDTLGMLEEEGVDVVVALTHMREHNDRKLAQEVAGIDLVLGGHDHFFKTDEIEANDGSGWVTRFCKSGTDFRDLAILHLDLDARGSRGACTVEHKKITSEYEPDETVKVLVDEVKELLGSEMDNVVGCAVHELNARTEDVRTKETNLGNLITDIVRVQQGTDICILNSGTIRSDDRYGPGDIIVRDITNILPMEDMMVVLELSGAHVLAALENSVSKYPAHEGRFVQVSGISFEFDPEAEPGSRVTEVLVTSGDDGVVPLDPEKIYTVSTKEYLSNGKDGFESFLEGKVVVDGECGVLLPTAVRNHFVMLKVLSRLQRTESCFHAAVRHFLGSRSSSHNDGGRRKSVWEATFAVDPKVEGRIRQVGDPAYDHVPTSDRTDAAAAASDATAAASDAAATSDAGAGDSLSP